MYQICRFVLKVKILKCALDDRSNLRKELNGKKKMDSYHIYSSKRHRLIMSNILKIDE